jgi:hypothetical protein
MTFTHPKDTNKQAVAPATASQAVGPPSGYASTCCTLSSVCKALAESSCGGDVSLFSILEVCSDEVRNMSSISITADINFVCFVGKVLPSKEQNKAEAVHLLAKMPNSPQALSFHEGGVQRIPTRKPPTGPSRVHLTTPLLPPRYE